MNTLNNLESEKRTHGKGILINFWNDFLSRNSPVTHEQNIGLYSSNITQTIHCLIILKHKFTLFFLMVVLFLFKHSISKKKIFFLQ